MMDVGGKTEEQGTESRRSLGFELSEKDGLTRLTSSSGSC